ICSRRSRSAMTGSPDRSSCSIPIARVTAPCTSRWRRRTPRRSNEPSRRRRPRVPSYFALGEAYRKAGRAEEAIRAYRQARRLAPDDARAPVAASELLLTRGEADAAIRLLEPALARMPDDSGALNSLAVLYARKQRFDDALSLLSKAVRISPDYPLSWLNLGVALEAKGDRQGAEAAYRQALLLQPDFTRARQYLER